jgi:hypothetical protein
MYPGRLHMTYSNNQPQATPNTLHSFFIPPTLNMPSVTLLASGHLSKEKKRKAKEGSK